MSLGVTPSVVPFEGGLDYRRLGYNLVISFCVKKNVLQFG